MESMTSKTRAMAVKDIHSFNGDDGWFGTVYRVKALDPAGHVNMLADNTGSAYASIVHSRADGDYTARVYRTDGFGNPLNLDGAEPDGANNARIGFITEISEQVGDASILTVLFNAL